MTDSKTESLIVTGKSINDLDDISMRLFMNKSNYNKYIEKTNPKEHEDRENYIYKLNKYMNQIMDITTEKIENHLLQHTTDLDNAFEKYMRTCIKHFEMKEIENKNSYNRNEDEDSLFVNMDENTGCTKSRNDNDIDEEDDGVYDLHLPPMINNFTEPFVQSFWGKPIKKTNGSHNPKKFFSKKERIIQENDKNFS
jgi:hypothetical protein